jgi:hypothetical protein
LPCISDGLCPGVDNRRSFGGRSTICKRAKRGGNGYGEKFVGGVFTRPNLGEIVNIQTGMTFGEHIRISDEKNA